MVTEAEAQDVKGRLLLDGEIFDQPLGFFAGLMAAVEIDAFAFLADGDCRQAGFGSFQRIGFQFQSCLHRLGESGLGGPEGGEI